MREKATAELKPLGDLVEPQLRKLLAKRPSLEVSLRARKRLELMLIEKRPSTQMLRVIRAGEVLECIGTLEAAAVLKRLSKGPFQTHLTREARAAWQ